MKPKAWFPRGGLSLEWDVAMSDRAAGQASDRALAEIDVTPEMISAGMQELSCYRPADDSGSLGHPMRSGSFGSVRSSV